MPSLVHYRGDDEFSSAVTFSSQNSGLLFSINSHVEIYCPPRKRSRITAPYIIDSHSFENKKTSIDILPDECLFEIFKRLPSGQERSASACVSKKWLNLLSTIRSSEFTNKTKLLTSENENLEMGCDGYLTRCIEGKKSTDTRLFALAVGTSSRGGLGKLSIRGSNTFRGVSNKGLSAIARGCPSLRVLSLWDVPSIGDEGLYEIARECFFLEKIDLCRCDSITDKGLSAIAKSSPNLTTLTIESCANIGNASLQEIAKHCPKLESITIKDCNFIGDQGIASLFSSGLTFLSKVKLQGLNITDYSVAVIGHYGKSITSLVLNGLQGVSQKGFWVMGNAKGLQMLSSLSISSCKGITDLSLEALGKGCNNLKQMFLKKCCFVSDNGLVVFSKGANFLESLQLEECNRITQIGILNALSNSNSRLKSVSVVKCMGIKDLSFDFSSFSPCESIRSLSIRNCPGFGSTSLAMVGKLCPNLHHLDLSGLCGITDEGLLPLLETCEKGLVKVNLSDCSNLTDCTVLSLSKFHGQTLEVLNLENCRKITDVSLVAISNTCHFLNDLDLSKCSISDYGVSALSCGVLSNLQILSLSGCTMLSEKSIPALEKLGKTLLGLNLQHCNAISGSKIESLAENLWRCDLLS